MKIHNYGLTDVGQKREHNEDCMLSLPESNLFIVCDGMGGYAAGEVASDLASKYTAAHIQKNKKIIQAFKESPTPNNKKEVHLLLEDAISKASSHVFEVASKDESKKGMGTTIVLLLVIEGFGFVAHCGDSRCYLIRDEEAHQITDDHSMVNEMVKQGILSKDKAEQHPQANLVTRAVGIQPFAQADVLTSELMEGDKFILCSDGLSGYLTDSQLFKLSGKAKNDKLPQLLIDHANKSGGKDNITAILVSVGSETAPPAHPEDVTAQKKIKALKKISLFKNFGFKELSQILEVTDVKTYKENEVIVEEGTLGQEMYVILSGHVNVDVAGKIVKVLKPGQYFGEMSLIDQSPRSASITTTEPTKVLLLSRKKLFGLLKKESRVGMKMFWSFLQNMNKRLRENDKHLSELMSPPASNEESNEEAFGSTKFDLEFLD